MSDYLVKWGFIDKSGVSRKAGETLKLDAVYGDVLVAKGLVVAVGLPERKGEPKAPENKGQIAAPENKAAKKPKGKGKQ